MSPLKVDPGDLSKLLHRWDDLIRAVLARMDRRVRIGRIDHSPGSYDWRMASAHAHRIRQRLVFKRRLSRRQALAEAL